MYSVPPNRPARPEPVRWPRTLLLPPRRRRYDQANLGMRLLLVLIQVATNWSVGYTPFQRALLWGIWTALLLGPTAELLPITWQRMASVLRILQLVVGIVTGIGLLWWWSGT